MMQHDMPFCANISHAALLAAASQETTQGYPFNVRFNKMKNKPVGINRGKCWNANTILSHHTENGLQFIKTPSWSDNNQFASTAYYRHMFAEWINTPKYERFPMEYRMQFVASRTEDTCLGYGQYLYGKKGQGPHIDHLDGRLTGKSNNSNSEKGQTSGLERPLKNSGTAIGGTQHKSTDRDEDHDSLE